MLPRPFRPFWLLSERDESRSRTKSVFVRITQFTVGHTSEKRSRLSRAVDMNLELFFHSVALAGAQAGGAEDPRTSPLEQLN
jgi:hypothetical protein